jgi:hypothetical protein
MMRFLSVVASAGRTFFADSQHTPAAALGQTASVTTGKTFYRRNAAAGWLSDDWKNLSPFFGSSRILVDGVMMVGLWSGIRRMERALAFAPLREGGPPGGRKAIGL